MASVLESSGFASLWVSDHVVMPATVTSRYPYADDGVATWATDDPWYDSIVALAMAAAVTDRVELGHRRARAAATQPGRARQAGRQPRSARRRPRRAGGRRRVAGRGVRRAGDTVRVTRQPHRRVDRRVAAVLDRSARCLRRGPLPAASRRRVRADPGARRYRSSSAGRRRRRCGGRATAATAGSASSRPTPSTSAPSKRPSPSSIGTARKVLRIVGSAGLGERIAAALPDLAAAGITDVVVDVDWSDDVAAQAASLLAAAG